MFGIIALGGIFALAILMAHLEIKDLDLWLHIGVGRHIVENGFHVPQTDFLSATVTGTPWNNHEWLFQVLAYLIYQDAGPEGLILMQVILVTVTLLLLSFLGYSRERQFFSVFGLLFVVFVYIGRFTIRPDLFSLFFFTLYIFLTAMFLDRKWTIPAFFLVQVIWTNMHGFFFFGPVIILLSLVSESVKRHLKLPWQWNAVSRLEDDEYRNLKWMFVAAVLACFINPAGIRGAIYPIVIMFQISGKSKIFFDHIVELQKPITRETLFSLGEHSHYRLLLVISAVSFFFNRRKMDIGVFVFWLIFLFFSLGAARNMAFFSFAAYLAFMNNVMSLSFKDVVPMTLEDKKFGYIAGAFAKMMILIVALQFVIELTGNGYFDFDKFERKSEFGGVSQRNFPDKAVDFLVEHKVRGNIFNDFNSGAYLVGRTFPDIKVFIDGRTEVYGPDFFQYYKKIWMDQDIEEFDKAVEKYNLTVVLINTVGGEGPPKLLKHLYASVEWIPVYLGHDAVIFLKDVPQNQEVISQTALDLEQWQAQDLDIYRLGSRKVVPYQHLHRGFILKAMGLNEAATKELQEALYIYPAFDEAMALLGDIYAESGDFKEAFYYFRTALTFNVDSYDLRFKMGKAYDRLGMYTFAVEQYERLIETSPSKSGAYFELARTLFHQGKGDESLVILKKAHDLQPENVHDVVVFGDLFAGHEKYREAVEVYSWGLGQKADQAEVQMKMGDALNKIGNFERAHEFWSAAFEADPEFEGLSQRLEEDGQK